MTIAEVNCTKCEKEVKEGEGLTRGGVGVRLSSVHDAIEHVRLALLLTAVVHDAVQTQTMTVVLARCKSQNHF